jgi:HlyD family secretion protein
MNRKTGFYIIAVILILALGYGFMSGPVPVSTAEAVRGRFTVTVEEEGKTRVVNRYVISAPISGYLLRSTLDVGDAVQKGQLLAELEPLRSSVLDSRSRAEAEARVAAARASFRSVQEGIASAQAAADFALRELDRMNALYKETMISEAMLDSADTRNRRAEADLRSAKFALQVAQYEKEAANAALKYSASQKQGTAAEKVRILSPVKGRILKVHRESEGVLREGEALFEVGDLASLEIEVDVLSEDAVRISPGMKVIFEGWGGESSLEGRVRVIEPAGFTKISALGVEEQRVIVISDIVSSSDEWGHLGDGYRAEAKFIVWEKEDVLQIPSSALFRYRDGWAVFVMKNRRAYLQEVEVGRRNGLSAEIISGLAEKDLVITHPDSALEDRMSVKLRK